MLFLHKMLNLGFQNLTPIFLRVLFLVATLFCTYGYLFELIFALLKFECKGVKSISRAFPKLRNPVRFAKFPMGSKFNFFPNGKHILTNSLIIF